MAHIETSRTIRLSMHTLNTYKTVKENTKPLWYDAVLSIQRHSRIEN